MPKLLMHLLLSFISPLLLLSILSTISASQPDQASTLTVDTLVDEGDGCEVNNCSLREAIAAANHGDTIDFIVSGTIDISGNGQLIVDKSLTISSNLPITISGNNMVRVFKVMTSTTPIVSVTFRGLTIAYGNDAVANGQSSACGGGIYLGNGTAVTITHSVISNNVSTFGGGIYSSGAYNGRMHLTINNSTLSNNVATIDGGGIYNASAYQGSAQVTINNSTLISNSANSGAGGSIYNISVYEGNSHLTINNSTLSYNSANNNGGGIYNYGDAEGDLNLMINNSTLSQNSADTGGGVYNFGGDMYLSNSIIANSTKGGDCYEAKGKPAVSVGNLIEDNSCHPSRHDDPLLASLADNGGDTLTHALLIDSPAIDRGDEDTCLLTDQRGINRPQDGDNDNHIRCDIGAFEVESWSPTQFITYFPLIMEKKS